MPAIWASSERPLFVRTVWVNGMRHAVLSPDDPVVNPRLRRHPRTPMEKSFPAEHQQAAQTRLDRLSNCFMNLHVVVEKTFPDSKIPPRIVRRQSAPPCTRMCSEKTSGGLLEIYVNDVDRLDEDRANCRTLGNERTAFPASESPDYNGVGQSLRSQREAFSATTERQQADRSSDAHWNPLSERVLQWLDLSGRAQDYELETGSEENPRIREDRRWSAARRRRHLSQTREGSVLAERERVAVQNYKLQKNFKLECEAKIGRRRSRMKDKTEEIRNEGSVGPIAPATSTEEDDSRNENESRGDRSAAWSPAGRLQLHIVMPSFNSVEKRASSLESLACD